MLKKFVLNMKLRGKALGTILTLEVDKDGIPLDRYWRDRWKEAKNNNCMAQYTVTKTNTQKIEKATKARVATQEKLVKKSKKKKEDNS